MVDDFIMIRSPYLPTYNHLNNICIYAYMVRKMSNSHKEAKRPNNGHQERKKKKIDKVQCDGRLKIIINRENELQARWPERWGFYSKNNVERLWSDEAVNLGLPANFIDLRRQKLRKQDRIQPLLDVAPTPNHIPLTSSGFVGWRASHKTCNLEIFGRFFAYNKLDTSKLKSDNEPDQKQQKFIILG